MDTNNPVRICVPLCERSLEDLEVSASKATSEGDAVEFRLDCLAQSELDQIDKLLRFASRTDLLTILTLRPSEEGGKRELDYGARDEFWRGLQKVPGSYLMDLELDLVEGLLSS